MTMASRFCIIEHSFHVGTLFGHISILNFTTGHGLKVCSAYGEVSMAHLRHSYTSLEQVCTQLVLAPWVDTAKAEVFMKTIRLFCSLS